MLGVRSGEERKITTMIIIDDTLKEMQMILELLRELQVQEEGPGKSE